MVKKLNENQGFWTRNDMLCSKAFKALTPTGKEVLSYFLARRPIKQSEKTGKYDLDPDKKFAFTFVEAKGVHGISSQRFTKGKNEVIGAGFIVVVRAGGGLSGRSTLFKTSEMWRNYGDKKNFKVKIPAKKSQDIGFIKQNRQRKEQLKFKEPAPDPVGVF